MYLGPCKHTDVTGFTIFTKSSIIDVLQGPDYASEKLAILEHTDANIYKKLRIPRISLFEWDELFKVDKNASLTHDPQKPSETSGFLMFSRG